MPRLMPGLIWLVIVALGVLGALPCVIHCDSNHGETATTGASGSLAAWFLCDFPARSGLPSDQVGPHHHHTTPQPPLEPALAFVGVVVTLLLTGRMLQRLQHLGLPLLTAPPTPPPRLCPTSTLLT